MSRFLHLQSRVSELNFIFDNKLTFEQMLKQFLVIYITQKMKIKKNNLINLFNKEIYIRSKIIN